MTTKTSLLDNLWHQLSPWSLAEDEHLQAIAAYLSEPATQALLDSYERSREYPQAVREQLHSVGLSNFFAEEAASIASDSSKPELDDNNNGQTCSKVTTVHLCALNHLTAAVNTSLAVTVGVNPFALLPVYIAADQEQLAWVFERVKAGAYSAMLLSESQNGSNLLRNQARAEAGLVDAEGKFQPGLAPADQNGAGGPTHYRLSGQKDLINGGSQHDLLLVFARTRQADAVEIPSNPLAARSDFDFFIVERDASVDSPQRWYTLPVPAADIASARFQNTIVPAGQRLGRAGSGFTLAQKTLAISRGGVGAFAAGLASRAVALATTYARTRNIYGEPILNLGAITDHLLRMQALELLVAAMSVKATAALNSYAFGAGHYGAVAKYACCVLTEELVTEGRYIHGARAFLLDQPYHRLVSDAALLSTFDGTTHLVLDQIQWRLDQLASAGQAEEQDWLDAVAAIYRTPPQSLLKITRARTGSLLIPPVAYLEALAATPGELPLQPLAALSRALLALVRHCRAHKLWEADQGLRFEAGKLFAYLETLAALVELADPPRRRRLRLPPLVSPERLPPLLTFTYGWFGGQITAGLRSLMARVGLVETGGHDTAAQNLGHIEKTFGQLYAEGRNIVRNVSSQFFVVEQIQTRI